MKIFNQNIKWLFVGAIISLIAFYIFKPQKNNRQEFEAFLLSKYSEFKHDFQHDKGKPLSFDNPEMAFFQNYLMTVDPQIHRVPTERLSKARNKAQEILHNNRSSNGLIDIQWNEVPANAGGRTRAIMFDPNDPEKKKVWAGSATGSLS